MQCFQAVHADRDVHGQDAWNDRGQGTLTLRQEQQPEGDSSNPPATNVVFTVESGRILVNGALYKGMQIKTVRLLTPCLVWHFVPLALAHFTRLLHRHLARRGEGAALVICILMTFKS